MNICVVGGKKTTPYIFPRNSFLHTLSHIHTHIILIQFAMSQMSHTPRYDKFSSVTWGTVKNRNWIVHFKGVFAMWGSFSLHFYGTLKLSNISCLNVSIVLYTYLLVLNMWSSHEKILGIFLWAIKFGLSAFTLQFKKIVYRRPNQHEINCHIFFISVFVLIITRMYTWQ